MFLYQTSPFEILLFGPSILFIAEAEHSPTNQGKNKLALRKCRAELITSLQLLGDYESLLTPPQLVLVEANQAAAKAIMFLSGNPVGSGCFKYMSTNDMQMKCYEHLIKYFVRNNVLKPIIDAFVSNDNRYNMFHSAVLELFEFIRKVNDERALEIEEERYFNEDSDEEDTASVPCNLKGHQQPNLSNGVAASYSHLRSLVDYEDDKDYKPPPRKQPETSEEDDGVSQAEETNVALLLLPGQSQF
ncbi:hypothetical protein JHK87_004809 [Glycine soja]|nr:hypothetical protein JHK87_004809 [Glycine soja]